MNIESMNSIGQDEQDLVRWSLGEPTSSGAQNENIHNEWMMDHGLSSSMSVSGNAGPSLEEQWYEPNSPFVPSSNSDSVPQSLNLNAGLVGHGNDSLQVIEGSNLYKTSGSENEQISPDSDSRRLSCKRKALDGNVGQSSSSGSSSYIHHVDSSAWHGDSASYNAGSSVNMSALVRQVRPRLGFDVRGLDSGNIPGPNLLPTADGSRRDFGLRISPSSVQQPMSPIFSAADTFRPSVISPLQQPSRLLPNEHSLNSSSGPVVHNRLSQNPNVVIHVPTLPQNVQPFRLNVGSGSRTGSSSSFNVSGDREAVPGEAHRSKIMARNRSDHPMLVPPPELRTSVRNPTNQGLSSENIIVPGNGASFSHASSSSTNTLSASTHVPHPNPNSSSRYPRRLSELVRRSLMSSLSAESEDQGNDSSLSSGPPTSPEQILVASGLANQGHHRSHPRSVPWLERQDPSLLRIPHSLRTLAAATEGRSRLVASEIRNVLNLMRRGENLRFEDVMILDQSVVSGIADMHDRHRGMRLDVDNMSYEELLALEERIGDVSTGLNEDTILNRLKCQKHSKASGSQTEAEPCCVCQEEYNDGEDLGTLECGHDFHADCIKQWLMRKNSCPICKTTGLTK